MQPTILHRSLGIEHRESGLAARLLLTFPPRRPKQWTEAEIDPATEAAIARLFDRLFELQPPVGSDGSWQPITVRLSDDGKARWMDYYNSHNQEQIKLAGELAAAWSKLEEYADRLALVIHFVTWAAGDSAIAPDVVDQLSIEAGVTLAEWFKGEARRVYALLPASGGDWEGRRLVEWVG